MDNVLTLVAGSASVLDDTTVAAAHEVLMSLGAAPGRTRWLKPGRALDLMFRGGDRRAIEKALRERLALRPVDAVAQPRAGRRKRLLVADMDMTVTTVESIDELADLAGLRERIAPITARAMAGGLDFATALKARVAMLKGLDEAVLERTWRTRVALAPGAGTLVATMRAHGAYTVLVSGGFTFFTERVARAAGFDDHEANVLETKDGRLTGRVQEPSRGPEAKLHCLRRFAAKRGLKRAETMAVGDGANDLDMLQAAGLGVAFNAKPAVAAAAPARIDHGDLTALLYVQGYPASGFRDA
ncbi:MAG: phosphoserine phosphatase SerB [Alphaproteobacteria bacterium]